MVARLPLHTRALRVVAGARAAWRRLRR
jgi:hypothetical protein